MSGAAVRVSVVMPFLNAERFIGEAVESVLAQSYPHWELLLVDDGSTDGSGEIARGYAARDPDRVRCLSHPGRENRGASAARNLALREARGDLVAFLDADDVWLPEKLAEQVRLLDAHPEVGALYGSTLFWYGWTGAPEDGARDWLPDLGVPVGTTLAPPELLVRCIRGRAAVPCTCSIVLRREVVERVGGFEEGFRRVFTDQAFYTKVFSVTPVYVADRCWDRYRIHPESSCSTSEREGELRAARGAYLSWAAEYLAGRHPADGELLRAVRSALWLHRHPRIAGGLTATRRG
ncbi:MAG TPA: glycosyltransferase, partial [Longimicrobiaceae bacterium]|nr:glycosyltransferase [Longimicrobiaceae bacterium]